jgi:hypothetical protein
MCRRLVAKPPAPSVTIRIEHLLRSEHYAGTSTTGASHGYDPAIGVMAMNPERILKGTFSGCDEFHGRQLVGTLIA